jgi:trans-aconitate methyltransferase
LLNTDSSLVQKYRASAPFEVGFFNGATVQSDITDVELPTKLDIIFSNVVLHWVHDHIRVFQHYWNMINCNGDRRGQLLIQCGGYGNLRRVHALLRQVMKLNEFKMYFTKMNRPWYFAKPDDTTRLLKEIGYTNTRVSLHNDCVTFTNRKICARYNRAFLDDFSDAV